MALTDDDLLTFDHGLVPRFEIEKARETLASEHGDMYRTHLVAARWLEQWRQSLAKRPSIPSDERFVAGIDFALREVAAHLRQGDFVPGATVYEEMVEPGSWKPPTRPSD